MSATGNENFSKSIIEENPHQTREGKEKAFMKAEKGLEKNRTEETKEQKFQIEKLREHCMELFGVTASTFDGAFYGRTETELTKQEAQAVIQKWLGKE